MKVCSKCKVEKDESEFHKYKNRSSRIVLKAACRKCIQKFYGYYSNAKRESDKRYRKNNKDTIRRKHKEGAKKRYRRNKEKFQLYSKSIQQKARDELKDSYIIKRLVRSGFPTDKITSDVIGIKRLLLKTKREIKKHENKD